MGILYDNDALGLQFIATPFRPTLDMFVNNIYTCLFDLFRWYYYNLPPLLLSQSSFSERFNQSSDKYFLWYSFRQFKVLINSLPLQFIWLSFINEIDKYLSQIYLLSTIANSDLKFHVLFLKFETWVDLLVSQQYLPSIINRTQN